RKAPGLSGTRVAAPSGGSPPPGRRSPSAALRELDAAFLRPLAELPTVFVEAGALFRCGRVDHLTTADVAFLGRHVGPGPAAVFRWCSFPIAPTIGSALALAFSRSLAITIPTAAAEQPLHLLAKLHEIDDRIQLPDLFFVGQREVPGHVFGG